MNLDKYKHKKTAAIIGNGPSLRDFDFKEKLVDYTTFGMNAAYRYWDKINWYPDYYSCLDLIVGLSHKDEIKRLIENSDEYGIKKFLLRDNLMKELQNTKNYHKIINFDEIRWQTKFMYGEAVTTGSNTATWAAELGFENILLLGIDSNYIETMQTPLEHENYQIVMQETPTHNPNYFFDDYQQKGDRYTLPNPVYTTPETMIHRAVWKSVGHRFSKHNILVLNCSELSKIEYYHKIPFKNALDFISKFRSQEAIFIGANLPKDYMFNENDLIINYFQNFSGTCLYIGTHHGEEVERYLSLGWTIHGFEPDDNNRERCINNTNEYKNNFYINDLAVSDTDDKIYEFYISEESSAISSLHPYNRTHIFNKTVRTTSLKNYIDQSALEHVDLLHINAEGYDLKILNAFDFEKIQPQVILCDFSEEKTSPLGYSVNDMIDFLQNKGYFIYVSEWAPAYRYNVTQFFAQFFKAPGIFLSTASFGKLICFKEDPGEETLKKFILQNLRTWTNKEHDNLK